MRPLLIGQAAVDELGEILDHVPWDPTLREMRADAYLGMGNVIHAISDIRYWLHCTTREQHSV